MAINTLLQLWSDLHTEYQLSYLLANWLNQDCIEHLFLIIHGKGGHRDNPDASQSCTSLHQVMVNAVLVPSPRANCEEDVNSFLLTMRSIDNSLENATCESVADPILRPMSELPQSVKSFLSVISIPEAPVSEEERNVAAYTEGLICWKIRDKFCQNCNKNLYSNLHTSNEAHVFVSRKQYEETGEGLLMPSNTIQNLLEEFEQEIRSVFQNVINMNRVTLRTPWSNCYRTATASELIWLRRNVTGGRFSNLYQRAYFACMNLANHRRCTKLLAHWQWHGWSRCGLGLLQNTQFLVPVGTHSSISRLLSHTDIVLPLGNLLTLKSLTFRRSFSVFHCLPALSISRAEETITKTIPRDRRQLIKLMLRKWTFLPPRSHLIRQFIKWHLASLRREQHVLAQWLRQYFVKTTAYAV